MDGKSFAVFFGRT
jgi:hypothetical protein